jgi:hypothetical protein
MHDCDQCRVVKRDFRKQHEALCGLLRSAKESARSQSPVNEQTMGVETATVASFNPRRPERSRDSESPEFVRYGRFDQTKRGEVPRRRSDRVICLSSRRRDRFSVKRLVAISSLSHWFFSAPFQGTGPLASTFHELLNVHMCGTITNGMTQKTGSDGPLVLPSFAFGESYPSH